MVINNETILSPTEAIESLKKVSKRNYLLKYTYSIFLLIFGLMIMILAFTEDDYIKSITIGGSFFIISLGYIIYNSISIRNIPKNVAKKNPDIVEYGITNHFIFKEESFTVVCKIGKRQSKHEFKYKDLSKIINEEDKILFLVSPSDLIICKKEGFKSIKEEEIFFYGLSKHKIKVKDKTKKRV